MDFFRSGIQDKTFCFHFLQFEFYQGYEWPDFQPDHPVFQIQLQGFAYSRDRFFLFPYYYFIIELLKY